MRAFNVRNHPALGAVDDDEVQGDGAAVIVEGDDHIGLVELLAQDRGGDRAEFPGRALHQKIIGRVARGSPCRSQAWIEKLPKTIENWVEDKRRSSENLQVIYKSKR